jgi:hypothetical protein
MEAFPEKGPQEQNKELKKGKLGQHFISAFTAGAIGAGAALGLEAGYDSKRYERELSTYTISGEVISSKEALAAHTLIEKLVRDEHHEPNSISEEDIQIQIDHFLSSPPNRFDGTKTLELLLATAIIRGGVSARTAGLLLRRLEDDSQRAR